MIETLNAKPVAVGVSRPGPLGVVGGMGSLATAVFLQALARRSRAERDQDHVPVLLLSLPDIPDRSHAILNADRSAVDRILDRMAWLAAVGCGAIAIPCNTAHYWEDEFAAAAMPPFISMVGATRDEIESRFGHAAEGLSLLTIGTPATVRHNIYPNFRRRGFPQERAPHSGDETAEGERAAINALTVEIIRDVKAGHVTRAEEALHRVVDLARRLRPDAVILGCSELSAVAGDLVAEPDIVDPVAALADRCEAWWRTSAQERPLPSRGPSQKSDFGAVLDADPGEEPGATARQRWAG